MRDFNFYRSFSSGYSPFMKAILSGVLVAAAVTSVPAKDYLLHSWEKKQLSNEFWSEGANYGDFNKDGRNDIVSGPFWWEGPSFEKRHEFMPANQTFKQKKEGGAETTVNGFDPLA